MKTIVVAYDQHRGIGADNDLLWQRDLPDDLAHFKQVTAGGSLIMGRKTYDSIGRALPGRQNIVVSHQPLEIAGVTAVGSLDDAYAVATGEIFIIGGGMVYAQALPHADRIYGTEVHANFPQASVFFPELGNEWHEVSRESHKADHRNKYDFDFVVYERS